MINENEYAGMTVRLSFPGCGANGDDMAVFEITAIDDKITGYSERVEIKDLITGDIDDLREINTAIVLLDDIVGLLKKLKKEVDK